MLGQIQVGAWSSRSNKGPSDTPGLLPHAPPFSLCSPYLRASHPPCPLPEQPFSHPYLTPSLLLGICQEPASLRGSVLTQALPCTPTAQSPCFPSCIFLFTFLHVYHSVCSLAGAAPSLMSSQGLPWWLRWGGIYLQCRRPGFNGLTPVSRGSPGEGNCSALRDSCLENSMDRGDWRTTLHGVAKSRT